MKTKKLPIEYINKRKQYILFRNDRNVSNPLREGRVFEAHVLDFITKSNINIENTTVVDIGANLGCYTLELADMVGDGGKVLAFEPQRLVYYQLCGNVILNGYDNVYCYNVGLGDKEGTALLENLDYYYTEGTINIGNTHTDRFIDGARETIIIKTLDSYNLSNIRIIKMDVQGYESHVIDGMINTLRENKPYVLTELEDEQLDYYGLTKDDMISKWNSLNYDIVHLCSIDYVAIPKT